MSELRITPVQVPVSQARGVDEMGFAGQPSYPGQPDFAASMGFPGQPGAFAAPAAAPRSYSAPASGGALAAAYLIDMVCFAVLTALAWWVYPSLPVVVIVACELWIIATFIRARSGRTPGAFAMQIAAISTQPTPTERGMEFDRAPGLGRQSAHSFIMLLLHVTVVGPVITWAIARDGQTWVDRVCGMGNLDIRASRSGASEAVFASRQTSASEAVPGSVAAPSPAHQWAGPSASPEAVSGSVAASSPAPMAPPTTAPVQVAPPSAPVSAPDPRLRVLLFRWLLLLFRRPFSSRFHRRGPLFPRGMAGPRQCRRFPKRRPHRQAHRSRPRRGRLSPRHRRWRSLLMMGSALR